MRTKFLTAIVMAMLLLAGCKTTTKPNTAGFPTTELDSAKGTLVAPPGPGDVSRRFNAKRSEVVKSAWRSMDSRFHGDFAIDAPGVLGIPHEVSDRVRTVVGKGPGDRPIRVEIRPEGEECVAIVRASTPLFDEATAEIVLDKIEADLKSASEAAKTRSRIP